MVRYTVLGLIAVVSAASSACSASPGEASGESGGALTITTRLPEAQCTLLAGSTASSIPISGVMLRPGGYTGPDPTVTAFRWAIGGVGGGGGYTISTSTNGPSWYGIDVTHDDLGSVESIVDEYESTAPVYSGLYHCNYLWGDYELAPGQARPYVPAYIAAYDPSGCSGCRI